MRVWLLGGFRVSVGSRTIEENEWRLKKAGGLIKLLALKPGHRLHRERIMELLWPELEMTRLLTLAGAGGSGKTRFALEVARELVRAYPDGVWLAELAELSEEDLVPQK